MPPPAPLAKVSASCVGGDECRTVGRWRLRRRGAALTRFNDGHALLAESPRRARAEIRRIWKASTAKDVLNFGVERPGAGSLGAEWRHDAASRSDRCHRLRRRQNERTVRSPQRDSEHPGSEHPAAAKKDSRRGTVDDERGVRFSDGRRRNPQYSRHRTGSGTVCGIYNNIISLRPRNIRILFSSTKGHFSLFERSTLLSQGRGLAAGDDPTQPPSTSAVLDRHVSAASEVSPRPFKSHLSMPDRHLTTQLHPCSGVKVLLEATPTASGGHHKLHVHANRCARVPFQGKASDSSFI